MRTRMVRMGAVAAALSLLVVAGQATIALADGGPDRVLSPQVAADRPGFGDKLMPERPGFGDNLQPAASQAQPPVSTTTATTSDNGSGSGPWVLALIIGLGLAGLAGAIAGTLYRKRVRLAHTG